MAEQVEVVEVQHCTTSSPHIREHTQEPEPQPLPRINLTSQAINIRLLARVAPLALATHEVNLQHPRWAIQLTALLSLGKIRARPCHETDLWQAFYDPATYRGTFLARILPKRATRALLVVLNRCVNHLGHLLRSDELPPSSNERDLGLQDVQVVLMREAAAAGTTPYT